MKDESLRLGAARFALSLRIVKTNIFSILNVIFFGIFAPKLTTT